jgi:signal transduction histidine kinase
MSLRLRLTLWYVAILALTLVGLGAILRFRTEATLLQGLDRELALRANRPPPRRGARTITGVSNTPSPPVFFDSQGRSRMGDQLAPDPASVKVVFQTRRPLAITRGDQRVYTAPAQPRFVFQTTGSVVPLREQLAAQTRELLALLPLALLIAAGGGLFLTERALRPMREMAGAAEQIGAGDLSRRLHAPGNDELSQLARTFNGMLARLETAFGQLTESLTQQRRFVGDASHELKTPLTSIKINTDLALDDTALSDATRDRLIRVRHATNRTIRLVQNLLLLARGDAEVLALECDTVDTGALFAEVVQTVQELHPSGAAIVTQCEVELHYGDWDYLVQLLVNLVDNAQRHTPMTGTVTLLAHAEGFTVTDTGAGIYPISRSVSIG